MNKEKINKRLLNKVCQLRQMTQLADEEIEAAVLKMKTQDNKECANVFAAEFSVLNELNEGIKFANNYKSLNTRNQILLGVYADAVDKLANVAAVVMTINELDEKKGK
jgi:oligoendopeptidase F